MTFKIKKTVEQSIFILSALKKFPKLGSKILRQRCQDTVSLEPIKTQYNPIKTSRIITILTHAKKSNINCL